MLIDKAGGGIFLKGADGEYLGLCGSYSPLQLFNSAAVA